MLLTNVQSFTTTPITVPTTFIKNPGFLISSQNSSIREETLEPLPDLLENFKTKSNLDIQNITDYHHKNGKQYRESISISSAIQRYSEIPIAEPGRIKQFSEELSKLISIAQKVLSRYEIKLTVSVDVSSKHSKSILTVLRSLIPEVSYFSTEFFRDLEIKEFVLCEEEPSQPSQDGSSSTVGNNRYYFPLKSIDCPLKAQQRLFLIILNRLISLKPTLIQQWGVVTQQHAVLVHHLQSVESLQNTFVSLMNNFKKVITNENQKELIAVLEKNFPKLSEQWFKNRIAEKRKNTKVTFNL